MQMRQITYVMFSSCITCCFTTILTVLTGDATFGERVGELERFIFLFTLNLTLVERGSSGRTGFILVEHSS